MATQIPDIALEITLSWVARFNRHKFFTKELYKKLPAYKKSGIKRDKTEIQVAFICKALQDRGITRHLAVSPGPTYGTTPKL